MILQSMSKFGGLWKHQHNPALDQSLRKTELFDTIYHSMEELSVESTHTIFAAISQFDMHTCYISHAMSSISPSFVDHSVTLDRLRVEGSEVAGITQQQVSPNPHLSANQDKTNYILTHRRFSREVIVIPPPPISYSRSL